MSAYDGAFHIGSLSLRLRAIHEQDLLTIAQMFKQPFDSRQTPGRTDAIRGEIEIVDAGPADRPEVPPDGMVLSRTNGSTMIASEVMTARLEQRDGLWRARIAVRDRGQGDVVYGVHLSVVIHRILLALGHAYLHAAAVTDRGHTFVFVGEKGAGKSSIAMSLGRTGATILSDDHVLLRSGAPRYSVSGCDAWARVTAETEAAVFRNPLPIDAEEFAGTSKKQFLVSEFFASRPNEDAPITALFFPRLGSRLALTPRTARAAAVDLIQRTRQFYRPQDSDDVRALLDFWLGLVQAAPSFGLELSPNVGDLSRLDDLLGACVPRS